MGTVPMGTGELRTIHSRVVWMSGPVDRSMTVSAPQWVAQVSFSTSSATEEVTAEFPMLAFTFTRKAPSDGHGLGLGMVDVGGDDGAARRHLVAHRGGVHLLAQGHELHLGGDLAAPGVVQLGHRVGPAADEGTATRTGERLGCPGAAHARPGRRHGGSGRAPRAPRRRRAPRSTPGAAAAARRGDRIRGPRCRRGGPARWASRRARSGRQRDLDERDAHARRGAVDVHLATVERRRVVRTRAVGSDQLPVSSRGYRSCACRHSLRRHYPDQVDGRRRRGALSARYLRAPAARVSRTKPTGRARPAGGAVCHGGRAHDQEEPPVPAEEQTTRPGSAPATRPRPSRCPTRTATRCRCATSPASPWSCTSTRPTTRRGAPKRRASSTTTCGPSPGPVRRWSASRPTAPRSTRRSGRSTGCGSRLLSDTDHAVMERYGAWGEKTLYGKKSVGVIRSTFLVGADGKVRRAWYHVKADGHAEKVLAEIGD